MTKAEIALVVFEVVNNFFDKTVVSITNDFMPILDEIVFLSPQSIGFNNEGNITGNMSRFADILLIIANSLIVGALIYYGIRSIFSYFLSVETDNPWRVIIRIIILGILMNAAYFICYQAIYIISEITDIIRHQIGYDILSFENLNEIINGLINPIESSEEMDYLTVEGMISIFVHIGTFILGIMYAVRYIVLKVITLLSPIAFIFFMNISTEHIFKIWAKIFIFLTATQIIVAIVLGIPYIIATDYGLFNKIIICGIIVVLYRLNVFIFRYSM
jgi:hypothetical protein